MAITRQHFTVIVGIDLVLLLFVAFISGHPVAVMSTIILGFFLAVVIHELGHAFVGALYGMTLTGIVIGPVDLNWESGRFKVAQSRRGHLGGATIFEPSNRPPAEAVVAWRRMILAGPVTNLGLTLVLFWLALTFFGGDGQGQWKLIGFALISAFIGFANLVPISAGPYSTDGAKYVRMENGGPAAENEIRGQRLARWCASATRPRDWPADVLPVADYLLAGPADDDQLQSKVVAACFKYFYLADRGKLKSALQVLESVLASAGGSENNGEQIDTILAIQARHDALWNKNPERGLAIMSRMRQQSRFLTHSECQMTIALIKTAEGDLAGARHVVAEARRGLAPMIGRSGITRMETEWLDLVERRIDNPGAPARMPVETDPSAEPIIRMVHPPEQSALAVRIAALTGSPLAAASASSPANVLRRMSSPLAAEPQAAVRPSWTEAAFAVKQSGGAHVGQLAAEYGAARSWLYRSPGVPVEPLSEWNPVSVLDAPVSLERRLREAKARFLG